MSRRLCWFRTSSMLVTGLVLGTGTVRAQRQAGYFEVGAFAQINGFDKSLVLDDVSGPGARLGYFFHRKLSLEFDVSYAQTGDSTGLNVSYVPLALFVVFNLPIRDNLALLLGPGYVHTIYGLDRSGSDNGIAGLAGIRIDLTRRVSLRVEGRADYFGNPQNGAENNINYSLNAGLSYFIGRSAPTDSDGDAVFDHLDQCPNTDPGLAVDATGCAYPVDSDGDGVLDAVDSCPGTPAGQRIDASGCPLRLND